MAHTDRYGGMWAPITAELVREVAYDTDHFTSRAVVVSTSTITAQAPIGGAPPITSDPPFHALARRLLLPPFAPKQIEPWEPEIRKLCVQRLDDMGEIEPGETIVDAALQYAQHIPVNVIARMLGFPVEDDDMFRQFVHDILEGVNRAPEDREASFEVFDRYIDEQIERHVDEPRDDLTSYLMDVELGGQKLSPEHVRGSIVLLLLAGIDTTWSAIGSSLWHLASHPDDRRRLVAEPELMPTAIEELLRAYAPGDDGPHGRRGPRLPRLPDEDRRLGAAAVPGRQPRSRAVRPGRRGRSSTGWRTATPRSASASTAASARTWPGSSCASPSRSSSAASPSSSWPTPPTSAGASARSAAPAASRCASSPARSLATAAPWPHSAGLVRHLARDPHEPASGEFRGPGGTPRSGANSHVTAQSGSGAVERERDREAGAAGGDVGGGQRAAVGLDELAGDRQPEPAAGRVGGRA